MNFIAKAIIYVALTMFGIVSIWTTYASLHDSILPKPEIPIPLPNGAVWQCSIFAFLLSLAIGLMLFALKMAIIDEEKRLNFTGFIGLLVVASISITFNMDVLYRVANQDFYLSYTYNHMRSAYDQYLADVQNTLQERKDTLLKDVALQEGELEAEVEGLRQAPAGYGSRAKQEDYALRKIQKTSAIELQSIEDALASKTEADELLAQPMPTTVAAINDLQNQLRVAVKDAGAVAGKPLPPVAEAKTPLFAVFSNLLDPKKIGFMEIFFLALAVLLDLGDIVGYSLIPNKQKKTRPVLQAIPEFGSPEVVYPAPARERIAAEDRVKPAMIPNSSADADLPAEAASSGMPPRRPMRFLRRR